MTKFRTLIQQRPAVTLTVFLAIIIVGFVITRDWSSPANPDHHQATTSAVSTHTGVLSGQLTVECHPSMPCDTKIIKSAYDIVVTSANAGQPTAILSADQQGTFRATLPAGHYRATTSPAISQLQQSFDINPNRTTTITVQLPAPSTP